MANAKSIPQQQDGTDTAIPSIDSREYPDWAFNYPSAPGYGNGCASGTAASLAFVKYLQHPNYRHSGGTLQHLVLELADKLNDAQSEGERDAVKGKIVGIFSQLEQWVHCGALCGNSEETRSATPQSIHQSLQDAAEGGPDRRWEFKLKAEASERARNAANAGWEKRRAQKLATV